MNARPMLNRPGQARDQPFRRSIRDTVKAKAFRKSLVPADPETMPAVATCAVACSRKTCEWQVQIGVLVEGMWLLFRASHVGRHVNPRTSKWSQVEQRHVSS